MNSTAPVGNVRCYYWGEGRPLVNLGDMLVPILLRAMGLRCVPRATPDSAVINPRRCLIVIGSLLTEADLVRIDYPVDVWGCGWKGRRHAPRPRDEMRVFAVRGPLSATGLGFPEAALGDPALLLPHPTQLAAPAHGRALLIPHFSRIDRLHASERLAQTGCDEVLSPLVRRSPWFESSLRSMPRAIAQGLRRWSLRGIPTRGVWDTLRRISGASFVLTGSLHGAILAQAFGIPWACFGDDHLDAPAKWNDWGAYLDVDIEVVGDRARGEAWWSRHGCQGRTRDLGPLLDAFPYDLSTFKSTFPWSPVRAQ